MKNPIVFSFKCFFGMDEKPQERCVVAYNEQEAWEKINKHFETLHSLGFLKPCYIGDPIVELDSVII